MARTHVLFQRWNNGGAPLEKTRSFSSGQEVIIDDPVTAGETDQLFACAIDVSQLKLIVIVATKDLTLKTNSSSDPDKTIDLLADVPFIWDAESEYFPNPFGNDDITALYLSNAGEVDAQFTFCALIDPTLD